MPHYITAKFNTKLYETHVVNNPLQNTINIEKGVRIWVSHSEVACDHSLTEAEIGERIWYYITDHFEVETIPPAEPALGEGKEENRSNKWDKRFIEVARLVASWSKYPGAKMGAVLVKNRRILATGYNGIPANIDDATVLEGDRYTRLAYTIHAEINAILNAAKHGAKVEGATIYINADPCVDCCKAMVQSGIKRIVVPQDSDAEFSKRWGGNLQLAQRLLSQASIVFERVKA